MGFSGFLKHYIRFVFDVKNKNVLIKKTIDV